MLGCGLTVSGLKKAPGGYTDVEFSRGHTAHIRIDPLARKRRVAGYLIALEVSDRTGSRGC